MIAAKPSKCKYCKQRMEVVGHKIHDECVDAWWTDQKAKIQAKKEREQKRRDRARGEELKTIPQLIKEAQIEFNAYIRLRDRLGGYPCISSGKPLDWSGNAVDAGHYRSVGAASHLRFDERNVHAQSKYDNQYKAGNVVEYRINLIKRIGLEAVEALESDNTPVKWDRDTLRQLKTIYRAKARSIKKESEYEELKSTQVVETDDEWGSMEDDTNGDGLGLHC